MDHLTIADYLLFTFMLIVFISNTWFMRHANNRNLLVILRPYPFAKKIVIASMKLVFIMGLIYTALTVYIFTRIMTFFSNFGGINTSSYIVATIICISFLWLYIQSIFISTLHKMFIREKES